MLLGIVSISVSALIALLYVIFRLKVGKGVGTFFLLLASYSYIAAAILSILVSTSINNWVYAFILLAITISIVGDVLVEIKDSEERPADMLNLAMIMCAAHRILNFVALIALVKTSIAWQPFVFSGIIALALATIIMTFVRIFKLQIKSYFLQTCSFFLIVSYIVTLSVWYTFMLPQILLFAIAMVLFLLSDIVLLRVHAGKKEGKTKWFILHNIFYFGAQLTIVAFLYFGFFTNY